MELEGSCLCGAVRWAVTGKVSLAHYCHCGTCRKIHGTGSAAYGSVRQEHFRWLSGEDARDSYRSSDTGLRWHCRTCGSPTPGEGNDTRRGVPLGPLAGEGAEIAPGAHIFAESKAPWDTLTDGLPCFDAWPPGFDFPVHPSPARPAPVEGVVSGSCLCGEVAYAVEGGFFAMRHCHCSRCRRARAAAHATNLVCTLDAFRWTRGAEHVREWKLPEARFFTNAFCARCGAQMPRVDAARGICVVPSGSLDADPGMRPTEHIFVASGARWFTITDALPQHAESGTPVPSR